MGLASNQIKKRNEIEFQNKKVPFMEENEFDIPPHLQKALNEHPNEQSDMEVVDISPYKI